MLKTIALVIRAVDYKENDRILTLLSPRYGRVEAACRGCRKPQSPLLSAAELFSLGEYVLYGRSAHYTVTSFEYQDAFFPVRENYDLLVHASFIISICETVAQPGEAAVDLFTLTTRTLSRLAYSFFSPRAVTGAFLLMLSALSGYRPRLDACVRCGRPLDPSERHLFNMQEGGLVCPNCASPSLNGHVLTNREIEWMQDVLKKGVEHTECLPENAPVHFLKAYVEEKLEKHFPAGRFIK